MKETARIQKLKQGLELAEDEQFRAQLPAPGGIRHRLRQAGISCSPYVYVTFVAVAVLAIAIAGAILLGAISGSALGAFTGWFLLYGYIGSRAQSRRMACIHALPQWVEVVAGSLTSGAQLSVALHRGQRAVGPGALGDAVSEVLAAELRGVSLTEATRLISSRIAGEEIVATISAIQLFVAHDANNVSLEECTEQLRHITRASQRAERDTRGAQLFFSCVLGSALLILVMLVFSHPEATLSVVQTPVLHAFAESVLVFECLLCCAAWQMLRVRV